MAFTYDEISTISQLCLNSILSNTVTMKVIMSSQPLTAPTSSPSYRSTSEFAAQRPPPARQRVRLAAYYLMLILITAAGILYGYYFSDLFFPSDKPHLVELILNLLKLSWLIPLPYALMNFYSFARYPVFIRPTPPPVTKPLGAQLIFRFVTRGHNPKLICETTGRAYRELSAVLPDDAWMIEVVSDNPLDIDCLNDKIRLITVPADYRPAKGAKYKARALNYAMTASPAKPDDWIIHLDEETGFDRDTVRAIHQFVFQQRRALALKQQAYPKIGQGVILYGKNTIVNWLTTLADSIRVGDDYGRFRLQFEHGKSYFGLHGSFIVINNALEQMIGFDHSPAGNITEDCYFALIAQSMGVEYSFIHAFMHERSPFNLRDFAQQRRRWFGGLWLCVLSPDLPLKERWILGTFMVLWSLSWLCIVMVYVNFLYPTGTPTWLAVMGGVSFLYYVSLYIIGYLRTFNHQKHWGRYLGGLLAQIILIPFFSIMEGAGVLYGLLSPPRDFFIVKKEV